MHKLLSQLQWNIECLSAAGMIDYFAYIVDLGACCILSQVATGILQSERSNYSNEKL